MITLAGLSHHTAPLEVRERLTIPEDGVIHTLHAAHSRFGGGAALVSTCNRLELYLAGEHDAEAIHGFLAEELHSDIETVARHMKVSRGVDAVRHLYAVASGIDSMVLGETEVLGQVRSAFSATVKAGVDDAVMSRLFHTAIRTGRRARTETGISTRALSVSSIAAQLARSLFPDLARASVLVIGAGEAGRLAAQALQAQGVEHIRVINRTAARAEALAAELDGEAVPFDQMEDALAAAHVVVAASGSPQALVDVPMLDTVMRQRLEAPLLIVDIGVPRDFEPAVRDLPGVSYHDLDDLQAIADRNAEARQGEVAAVATIVDEEAMRFVEWWEDLQVVPTIAALTERAESLRRGEMEKTLRRLRLEAADREHMEELLDVLSRAVVKQILADPIHVIRERGDRDAYLDAVRTLFRLTPPRDTIE